MDSDANLDSECIMEEDIDADSEESLLGLLLFLLLLLLPVIPSNHGCRAMSVMEILSDPFNLKIFDIRSRQSG